VAARRQPSSSPDRLVLRWEEYLRKEHAIPVQGQEALRELLASLRRQSDTLRQRVIALLNPRGARVVELADDLFNTLYSPTTTDNYAAPSCIDVGDRHAVFDAAHGYYVTLTPDPDEL
jgi:hypothetical protein